MPNHSNEPYRMKSDDSSSDISTNPRTLRTIVSITTECFKTSLSSASHFFAQRMWPTSMIHGLKSERDLFFNYGSLTDKIAKSYYTNIGPGMMINTLLVDQTGVTCIQTDEQGVKTGESLTPPSNSPILFCHGYGAGLGYFYKNLHQISLSTNRRVYAIDWIGMGRSSRPLFPWIKVHSQEETKQAIDYFVESIESWRKQHSDTGKIILVGHSLGGYLSAWYALKYPERVEKLVLVSPVGLPERRVDGNSVGGRKLPRWVEVLWNQNYTPQWMVRTVGPFGPRLVKFYADRRFVFPSEKESIAFREYLYHISADRGSGEYALGSILAPGAWARIPLIPLFKDLRVDTSIMYGDDDWMDPSHGLRAVEEMTSPGKVYHVSDAGHQLFLDNPDEFNSTLSEIINK